MKNTTFTISLLIASFAFMSKGSTSNEQNSLDVSADESLTQYIGKYLYEAAGIEIKIYSQKTETETVLYLFVPGEEEIELIKTGEHRFSFKAEAGFHVEFKYPDKGVFKELILVQPHGNVKAVRNGKTIIDDLATIDEKLIQRGFSGVVLVAQNDEIVFNKAYGRKNSQESGLNDTHTVFDMGSITKQFTAAAILKLSMQNKVSVQDKLSDYFDDVPDDKKNITIHQLLTHSSGLDAGVGEDYDSITTADFLNQVFNSDLISPVGTEFNYSNMGYSLLGLIIEKVSGKTYEAFLNQNIFKPSGMLHTGYVIPHWNQDEVANGFLDGSEEQKPNEQNWSEEGPYLNLKANGGLLTKAKDLLLWSQAIMDKSLLDDETSAEFLYPHFAIDGLHTNYGYGWFIENSDTENKLVHHSGGSDLSASEMWIYPNKGITIIVLSNTLDLSVAMIARKMSNFLLQP